MEADGVAGGPSALELFVRLQGPALAAILRRQVASQAIEEPAQSSNGAASSARQAACAPGDAQLPPAENPATIIDQEAVQSRTQVSRARQVRRQAVSVRKTLAKLGGPMDVATVLLKATSAEQRQCFLKLAAAELQQENAQFMQLGRHVADLFVKVPRSFGARRLLVQACLQSGVVGRREIRRLTGLAVSPGLLRAARCSEPVAKQRQFHGGRPSKRCNPAIRAAVEAILMNTSQETSIVRVRQNGDFQSVRNMLTTPHQLYWSSPRIRSLMSQATFYRMMRSVFRSFSLCKRRTDVCDICLHHDNKFVPEVQRVVDHARRSLETLWPGYCAPFDAEQDASVDSVANLQRLSRFVDAHPQKFAEARATWVADLENKDGVRVAYRARSGLQLLASLRVPCCPWCPLSRCVGSGCCICQHLHLHVASLRFDLHKAEADASHQLRSFLGAAAAFQWHFTTVRRQGQCAQELLLAPPSGTVVWLMDFKQNVTTPIGPSEGGSWWYATSRVQHTVFGLLQVVSGTTPTSTYFTFLTDVQDHSAHLVRVFLSKLLEQMPSETQTLQVWCDCGPHFRTYVLAYFLLVEIVQAKGIVVCLNFAAEHHGKGQVDGLFGRLDGFMKAKARTHVISSLDDLGRAYKEGAARTAAVDPSVQYVFYIEDPADSELQKPYRALQTEKNFEIQKTYCLESRPRGPLRGRPVDADCGVYLVNRFFSDRSTGEILAGLYVQRPADPTRSWKRSYRERAPEVDGVALPTLQLRYTVQKAYGPPLQAAAPRRPSLEEHAHRFARRAARKRAWAKKRRAAAEITPPLQTAVLAAPATIA